MSTTGEGLYIRFTDGIGIIRKLRTMKMLIEVERQKDGSFKVYDADGIKILDVPKKPGLWDYFKLKTDLYEGS